MPATTSTSNGRSPAGKRKVRHHTAARGRVRHPSAFGKVLYGAMTRAGMSANEFARRVGMSSGFVSGVYSGYKLPPVDRLKKWARTLKLDREHAAVFVLLGELEHVRRVAPTVYRRIREGAADVLTEAEGIGHGAPVPGAA